MDDENFTESSFGSMVAVVMLLFLAAFACILGAGALIAIGGMG